MANMKDIAQACGVSRTVVSLVLNGRDREVGISEKTREHVLAMQRKLGYFRDEFAVSMASRRSRTLAFVTEVMGDASYTGRIVNGIIDGATTRNLALMTLHLTETNHEEIFSKLMGWRVCGVVFHIALADHVADLLEKLREKNIPCVTVNLIADDVLGITTDDTAGVSAMVGLMKKNGAVHPALLIPKTEGSDYLLQRRQGFLNGMAEHYPGEEPEIVICRGEVLDVPLALPVRMKRKGIDAVICIADDQATKFLQAALWSGYKVPDDFLLAGYGGTLEKQATIPSLATVMQDFEAMGRIATELVLNPGRRKSVYLPVTLRMGDSVRRPRRGPEM